MHDYKDDSTDNLRDDSLETYKKLDKIKVKENVKDEDSCKNINDIDIHNIKIIEELQIKHNKPIKMYIENMSLIR